MIVNFFDKYFVDVDGKIYNIKTKNEIIGKKSWDGYNEVGLYNEQGIRVYIRRHRVVMEAYYGKSNLQVNHKNGNKLDNRLENLEYVTQSQNISHSYHILKNNYTKNLPKNNIKCFLINIKTNEKIIFESQNHLATFLNINKRTVWNWFKNDCFNKSKLSNVYIIGRCND